MVRPSSSTGLVRLLKCCPLGEVWSTSKLCSPPAKGSESGAAAGLFPSWAEMVPGLPDCPNDMYPLDSAEDVYSLESSDGSLIREEEPRERVSPLHYCLEFFPPLKAVLPFVCFPGEEREEPPDPAFIFQVYPVGMLVSLPFLAATLIVYASLRELRNLHGQALMAHISSLLLGYSSLAFVQLFSDAIALGPCKAFGYIVEFAFLATFFWLNVMCFDIWWVFGGVGRREGGRRMLWYSGYAWGGPLVILGLTLLAEYSPLLPRDSPFRPNFGELTCFFKDKEAHWAFFYGPVSVLLALNLLMFGSTARRICAHTKETAVLQSNESSRHNSTDKERFNLYLKLFLVMGINWVTEVVSFASGGPEAIWYISDVTNTLQGVFIFLIFVCKRRVLNLLKLRLCGSSPGSGSTSASRGASTTDTVLSKEEARLRPVPPRPKDTPL